MVKAGYQKDCNCYTSLSPLYATVSAVADTPQTARALVTMRGKMYADTQAGLRSLMPAETYDLSYSLIYQALLVGTNMLYFSRNTDKELFLLLYPEFRGRI